MRAARLVLGAGVPRRTREELRGFDRDLAEDAARVRAVRRFLSVYEGQKR